MNNLGKPINKNPNKSLNNRIWGSFNCGTRNSLNNKLFNKFINRVIFFAKGNRLINRLGYRFNDPHRFLRKIKNRIR